MPPIRNITQVTLDNLHEVIPEYIHGNNIIVQNYDDMKEVYLGMIRDRHLFTIDRDILVHSLIDLTYMFAPGDDVNKDNVLDTITLEDEDEGEDEDINDMIIQDISGMDEEESDDTTPLIQSLGGDDNCPSGL
tara:strand:- start:130 stop:528 length:399 start_codon:yes stop_codon:yes gene_type:complete